ncbi:hypothetical protein [Aerococcus tenax]|uniref:hypothetical protein n=1 Tax=Aerococcus tenax TaxID=3078812 RepID=UPI001E5F3E44|nr:hypothetical protein [Aerococcus tenax]
MQRTEKSIKTGEKILHGLENSISEEEFDKILEHSYAQFLSREGRPMEDVFRDLEKDL